MEFTGIITNVYGDRQTKSGKPHFDIEIRLPHGDRQKLRVWGDYETGQMPGILQDLRLDDKISGAYTEADGYEHWNAKNIRRVGGGAPQQERGGASPRQTGRPASAQAGDRGDLIVRQTCLKAAAEIMAALIEGDAFKGKGSKAIAEATMYFTESFYARIMHPHGTPAPRAPEPEPPADNYDDAPRGDEPPYPDDDIPFS
uniref:Uncharacterized protein n=1 Tax=viral metagenome TaxID=1070528 RepID=A0A6M3KKF2_9ZZZZ